MKKKIIILVLLAAVVFAAGNFIYERLHVSLHTDEGGQSVSIIGGADAVEEITATYTSISMQEAKEVFATKGDYIILDVRRADEYADGHIPGAINVANEAIGEEDPAELPDENQLIYVYCQSGRRSKQAADKLVALGYSNIVECGGFLDWTGDIEK